MHFLDRGHATLADGRLEHLGLSHCAGGRDIGAVAEQSIHDGETELRDPEMLRELCLHRMDYRDLGMR